MKADARGEKKAATMPQLLMACSTVADGSGMMSTVAPLAKHLSELGWGVAIVGPTRCQGQTASEAEALGALPDARSAAAWTPRPLADAVRASAAVGELGSRSGCRVVHVHGVWTPLNLAACMRARSRRVPYVLSPHGMLMPLAMQRGGFKKRLALWTAVRRNLEAAAVVHVSSQAEHASVVAVAPKARTCLIPWGVDLANTCLQRLAKPGRKRAAYIGRIIPLKGVDDLVAAWAAIRPVGWELRFIGDDPEGHAARLNNAIDAAELNGSVSIHPPVSRQELREQFRDIDLLLLPSHSENFGMVVAEALAVGVPVITTTATPWSGLVDRRCGWWVRDTAADLATAISEAVGLPPEALAAMGLRGRSWVCESFGWPKIAARFAKELYQPCC